MRPPTGSARALAAWWPWAAALCLSVLPADPCGSAAPQAATRPAVSGVSAEAAALAAKVLADPLDSAAVARLRRLRRKQAIETRSAYEALARGLEAYLQDGPAAAAPALGIAARSARAMSLTRATGNSLARILKEALAAGRGAAANQPAVCDLCGGTGQADCRAHRCFASGMVPCSRCKATGVIRMKHPLLETYMRSPCPTCRGTGVVVCKVCGGSGTIPCPRCKGKGKPPPGARPDPPTARAVRRVICKARVLSRGRIDLYSDRALAPSPKPQP